VLAALRQPYTPLRTLLTRRMTPARTAEAYRYARGAGLPAALELIDRYASDAAAATDRLPYSPARANLAALPARYVSAALRGSVAPEYRERMRAATARMSHARAAAS
jgi:hypothetical protein